MVVSLALLAKAAGVLVIVVSSSIQLHAEELINTGHQPTYDDIHSTIQSKEYGSILIPLKQTCLIIIDPWMDLRYPSLNTSFSQITRSRLLPLAYKAYNKDLLIVIFSNSPLNRKTEKTIEPDLKKLVDGHRVYLFYHQTTNSSSFSQFLQQHNIDSLIYAGYASNLCVLNRPVGMVSMKNQGFKLFFVPEASQAVGENFEIDNELHKNTTEKIARDLGTIVHWGSIMELLEN